jgi:hypothetical protein
MQAQVATALRFLVGDLDSKAAPRGELGVERPWDEAEVCDMHMCRPCAGDDFFSCGFDRVVAQAQESKQHSVLREPADCGGGLGEVARVNLEH